MDYLRPIAIAISLVVSGCTTIHQAEAGREGSVDVSVMTVGCTTGNTTLLGRSHCSQTKTFSGFVDPSTEVVETPENSGEAGACDIAYAGYRRFTPFEYGPAYPRTVTITASTYSPADPFKTGSLACRVTIAKKADLVGHTPVLPPPREFGGKSPGQYEFGVDLPRSKFELRIPSDVILGELKALRGGNGLSYSYGVRDAWFVQAGEPYNIILHLDVDITVAMQNLDCTIEQGFIIPGATLKTASLKNSYTNVDCKNNGVLNQLLSITDSLSVEVEGAINKSLRKSISLAIKDEDLNKFTAGDPILPGLSEEVLVQGLICKTAAQREAFCLRANWPYSYLGNAMKWVIGNAPAATQPADTNGIAALKATFLTWSPREEIIYDGSPYSYPSKGGPGADSHDMAIFGGLLCGSGEEQGCLLVKRSQSRSGQFWRSPRNVDLSSDTSQFSGDQFMGVVSYFVKNRTSTDPAVKEALRKYIAFIARTRVNLPNDKNVQDFGFKTCGNDAINRCLLQGQEWFWVNTLADIYGVVDAIPPSERNYWKRYEYHSSSLPFLALLTPAGYRSHLIGAHIFNLQQLGLLTQNEREAAAILAFRNPKNPFFLYLHLGKDESVAREVRDKCVPSAEVNRNEWAWERPEIDQAWKYTMGWDCVFMTNLLLQ